MLGTDSFCYYLVGSVTYKSVKLRTDEVLLLKALPQEPKPIQKKVFSQPVLKMTTSFTEQLAQHNTYKKQ